MRLMEYTNEFVEEKNNSRILSHYNLLDYSVVCDFNIGIYMILKIEVEYTIKFFYYIIFYKDNNRDFIK
jgi:hypothetical protein